MSTFVKTLSILVLVTGLAGCWNQGNCQVNFGAVSFGEQFEDLKEAFEAGALTPEEYELVKKQLIQLTSLCKVQTDVEEQ